MPAAGPVQTTDPPASQRAGEGDGAAGRGAHEPGRAVSGAPDDAPGGRVSGAPAETRPDPQPVSPPSAGPESGGTADPSACSLAEGADGAPPPARPVADGGDAPLLTDTEIHAWLTDETSPYYLEELGLRLALVHVHGGASLDGALAAGVRQTRPSALLPERMKEIRR